LANGSLVRSRFLVTQSWLERCRDDRSVVLIEVGESRSAYEEGHLPGAVAIDVAELTDPVRNDPLDQQAFERLMAYTGISPRHTVVLYSGGDSRYAAYACWIFRLYGHADVRLLDGGRKRWELAGRPLVTDVPVRPRTLYEALPRRGSMLAGRDIVLGGKARLVDVRSPREFTGQLVAPAHLARQYSRGGHIPGAINLPWSIPIKSDGTVRPGEELRRRYAAALSEPGQETIVYGLDAATAAHTVFILRQLLGIPDVSLYHGSWGEYASLAGAPVESGGRPYPSSKRVVRYGEAAPAGEQYRRLKEPTRKAYR